MNKPTFTSFADARPEEVQAMLASEAEYAKDVMQRVMMSLDALKENEEGFPINRYEHSLQTATRALKDDANDEMIVAALLHDIGDNLAPHCHAALAATVLMPYVSERTWWIVAHHDVFQSYYTFPHVGKDPHGREKFRGNAYFDDCAMFCEKWDQASFDASYSSLPLDAFAPHLERVFARKPSFSTLRRVPFDEGSEPRLHEGGEVGR